ncbi:MAG: phospholipid carrier-dependent glycosyltransferase [Solirubrobacteraceae bacterium]|nr:phospholipid carrier-dependent glycosyltransferase [Patulibacter sp.]
MSSARPTESQEIETDAEETPAPSDSPEESAVLEQDVNSGSTDARPLWARILGRPPVEVYVLGAISALLHFAFLSSPRAIVFDETYFRTYGLEYKAHSYYFDLHPPLGKLLIGLWGAITGVGAQAAQTTDPGVGLRTFPALCGTLLVIVVYYFIRRLSGSRRMATLGAGMLMLDNALLVTSRFTLMDSLLLLVGMGAVTLALASYSRTGWAYWATIVGAAFLGGMSITIKATGLSALALVGLLWLIDVVRRRRNWKPVLGQLSLLVVIPVMVYLLTFAIHFALLTKTGPGDVYMPKDFQATLKGNPNYDPNAHLSFVKKFKELNHAMGYYEIQADKLTHPDSSKWYTWPIGRRSVYLYYEQEANGKSKYIYEIPNVAVWWGALLGAAVVFVGIALRPGRFARWKWPLAFLFLGWMANWLPFAFIHRPMFIYHYFFALMFSIGFVATGLGALTGWSDDGDKPFTFSTRRSASIYWGILGVALILFLYFGPTTFGIPLTPQGLTDRMWLPTWR